MPDATVYAQEQRSSKEAVLQSHLPLVRKIGLHLIARLPSTVELDDLLQVGLIALLQARESYDASLGASFSTYAAIRIKGAMVDEVRRNDWVPRSVQQKMKRVSSAIRSAEARLTGPASDVEIARELQMELSDYQEMAGELATCRMMSLEDIEQEGAASGDSDPFARMADAGFRAALAQAITELPEKEQMVMSLYYGDELNLKEIGAVLGISESRVCQVHGQALARIRGQLCEWTG